LADGLVRCYDTADTRDGSPSGEGVFLACSFWLAESLLVTGRRKEAQQLFERLLALRNDVGFLSEEYDPQSKRLVGNFPHALSHIALVNTAHNLTRSEKPVQQRSGHEDTSNRSG
jgi:GH15 family glucan-1,4-alpha-glucosidase